MAYQDKIINMLTDAYEKGIESNNYKLFNCISPELDLIAEQLNEMGLSFDIDYAKGKTLDLIASNVNQVRGSVNDVVLRVLIKVKIAADMSEGTINTLLSIVGFVLSDTEHRSRIIELYNDIDNPEPAAFQIDLPIDSIIATGVTLGQFVQLLQHVKAAGIRIVADLQGSFEFGAIDEYGPEYETGFAPEDMSSGGSLGLIYDPENDDPLPI